MVFYSTQEYVYKTTTLYYSIKVLTYDDFDKLRLQQSYISKLGYLYI